MDVNPAVSQLFISDPMMGLSSRQRRQFSMFATHPPVEERIARLERMASGIR
jgi:Zn-dependent protease with chaperone function